MVHFYKVMQRDDIPLLSNFEVYKKLLPVRHVFATGKKSALYQIPYEALAHKLMEGDPRCQAGGAVPMAAPSGSGKTACILPSISEK